MNISVIICTHNRAESLRHALQSLSEQTLSTDNFEVLVIDNASSDHTKLVTDSFTELPLRYIIEPKVGLARARNTGWNAASTSYVAFLDDDAYAAPRWLEQIIQTFILYKTDELVVGGRVELDLAIPKPVWLDESLQFCLSKLVYLPEINSLNTTKHYLAGCNIAFKRNTLVKYDGFPLLLGRSGQKLLSGEEILLQKRVLASGGDIIYNDQALVTHHIQADRLTKKWFLRRMYWEGVTTIKVEKMTGNTTSVSTELTALLKQVFSFTFLSKANFTDVCLAFQRLGRVIGLILHR